MTAYFAKVDADLAVMLAALGTSFIDRAVTIPCGITRPASGNEPMEGGSWDEYSGSLFTRRYYYDNAQPVPLALPAEGAQITVDGKTVYVGKVKADAAAPLVTIPFRNNPPPR